MQSTPGYVPTPLPEWTPHSVGWNQLPTDVPLEEVERVVLSDFNGREMPTVLSKLPNVRSLATDCHLLDFTPADLPKLEELTVVGTSDVVLPKGPWPRLRSVGARDA